MTQKECCEGSDFVKMTAAVWSSEYALCLVHIQSEDAHKQTDATGRPSPAATNFRTQEQAVCPKRERERQS